MVRKNRGSVIEIVMLNISEGIDLDDGKRIVFKDVKEIVSILNEECVWSVLSLSFRKVHINSK